jgi:hypothetical protein|tara:strand:- start:6473 stop:6667 length:195 start_codon:yes stop_codon:yes gene_type:complete
MAYMSDHYMENYWQGANPTVRAEKLLEEAAEMLNARLIKSTVVESTGKKTKQRFVIEYECPPDN